MGRPRKWKDDAERKRAERAGQNSPPETQETVSAPESRYAEADALGRRYGEHEHELRLDGLVSRGLSEDEIEAARLGRISRAIGYQRFLVDQGRRPA